MFLDNQFLGAESSPADDVIEVEGNFPPEYNEMSSSDLPPAYVETSPYIHSPAHGPTLEPYGTSPIQNTEIPIEPSEQTNNNEPKTISLPSSSTSDNLVGNSEATSIVT